MANGGIFGWFWTYSNNSNDFQSEETYNNPIGSKVRYLDNILVSKNIKIEYANTLLNEYHNVTSDHLPIYADLLIY